MSTYNMFLMKNKKNVCTLEVKIRALSEAMVSLSLTLSLLA